MRFLSINLLTTFLLALSVWPASAFEARMSARNSVGPLVAGDTVTIDVFFDADQTDIILLSVALLVDSTFLEYQETASGALPIIYPAPPPAYLTTGAQPGYILYDAGTAIGMTVIPAVQLNPQQRPAWRTWPAPPVGQQQVNLNYAETNITDTFNTRTTGNNIWIGSMVLRVRDTAPNGTSSVELCSTCGGNILRIGAVEVPLPVTGAVTVTVPEPATLSLGVAAVASLSFYAVRLRRRRS